MNILIPVDMNSRYEAVITSIEESKYWAYIELDEGQIVNCEFLQKKEETNCWIDHIIIIDKSDYISEFKQKEFSVIKTTTQKSIDEIIEAFLLNKLTKLKP
ncbi:hypothetical protein CRU98_11020 [Arcobacter sp. CECT 8986]|uniref:hypothetical protein n=1 Tax=Arcobacter sp. CECT 8986 TaxID=2044507 RepID=UPI001009F9DC|nr:hypothetical protein [Arcobacter sp. CECT 8986]RXJ98044.1 hypothetical protein CRU98_11020 [Arcobacter sp. CECT 8986]